MVLATSWGLAAAKQTDRGFLAWRRRTPSQLHCIDCLGLLEARSQATKEHYLYITNAAICLQRLAHLYGIRQNRFIRASYRPWSSCWMHSSQCCASKTQTSQTLSNHENRRKELPTMTFASLYHRCVPRAPGFTQQRLITHSHGATSGKRLNRRLAQHTLVTQHVAL